MDFYLSQIILWTLNWVPDGWMICAGQSLPVAQYNALYSLIGNQFGGNTANFNLPDLRGRIPIGFGQGTGLANNYIFSKPYGTEYSTILTSNMPAHNHTGSVTLQGAGSFQVSNDQASFATPGPNMVLAAANTNAVDGGGGNAELNIYGDANDLITLSNALSINVTGGGNFTTNNTGGNQPLSNIPPVLALNYAMCVSGGLYPVRP